MNKTSAPINLRAGWSLAEIAYLGKNYRTATLSDIDTHLGRTPAVVKGMAWAAKVGLSRPENVWAEEELRCLQQFYPSEGQKILRRLPQKSDEAIRHKARELDLASPGHTLIRAWEEEEWQLLRQNLHLPPLDLLPLFPDRMLSSIKNVLTRLKKPFREQKNRPTASISSSKVTLFCSYAEKAFLVRWYETSKTLDEILMLLPGRSRSSIFSQAEKLGLSRPLSDWTDTEAQIPRDHYPTEGGTVTRRLPGQSPRVAEQSDF